MTRIAEGVALAPPPEIDAVLDLLLGPTDYSEEALALAWEAYGTQWRDQGVGKGWRCWGFWKFELGEDPPEYREQAVRLAELGLLTEEELARIAEDAERSRRFLGEGPPYYHGADRSAQERIDLYEAVQRVLGGR